MERQEVDKLINQVYRDSPPTDTLALNQVRASMQDKIVAWQQDFDRLPKPKLPPNFDRNSKRVSAFGSVRSMWPRRYDLSGAFDHYHLPSSSVSEAEEGPFTMRRTKGDSFASSASEASEPEPDTEAKRSKPEEEPITDKPPTDSPEEYRDPRRAKHEADLEAMSEKESKSGSDRDSDSTIGAARETGTQEAASNNDEHVSATSSNGCNTRLIDILCG